MRTSSCTQAQRKKLTAQRARTDAQVAREVEVIRELLKTHKKERALLALKRKKLQEKQLEHIDAWLLNVESLLLDIEAAKRSNLLVDALKSGNDAMEMQAAMPLSVCPVCRALTMHHAFMCHGRQHVTTRRLRH